MRNKGGSPTNTDYITVYDVAPGTFSGLKVLQRAKGKNAKGIKLEYKDAICAFDIETSRLPPTITGLDREHAVMYVWQFCVLEHVTIVGRTWEEFKILLSYIDRELTTNIITGVPEKLVVWVHNLSYEMQFLEGIFEFKPDDMFCVDKRKVLKANLGEHVELRCAYLHSNMSLRLYCKKMHVAHQKLSGDEFGYKEIRYPWTPLTDEQMRYALHDVIGLCEAIQTEMEIDGDDLYTVPLTSTGYVRRDIKRAMNVASRTWLKGTLPNEELYTLLREEFRGGDTHANRYYSAQVLYNVKSVDRSSSYPGVQMNHLYPIGRWNKDPHPSLALFEKLVKVRNRAAIARFAFDGLRLSNRFDGCPYLSVDKSRNIIRVRADNGRVLAADHLETTLNDIDMRIVQQHYTWDNVVVTDLWYCAYKPLPEALKDVIRKYYTAKTELKYSETDPRLTPEAGTLYTKAKNKLNAICGCSAQRPDKQDIIYLNGEYIEDTKTLTELLERSYKRAFFSYAWGAWCTAWARYELRQGIDLVQSTPGADFVYCDTDSVKYIGDVDWTEYNSAKIAKSTETRAVAVDPYGEYHYMEVYEPDGVYTKFATLGAKKYAFEKPGRPGETCITIAGVTKREGGKELDKGDEYGKGVERFADIDHPFLFKDAGGTEALYNDDVDIVVTVDGHKLRITRNIVIRDSTYLLGITGDYRELIESSIDLLNHINAPELLWCNDWHNG